MIRPGIGVQEDHGQAANALVENGLQLGDKGRLIQRFQHHQAFTGDSLDHLPALRRVLPVAQGAHAFIHLDHGFVQQIRLADLQVEDVGPVLVADLQDVAKPPGDQQGAAGPLALQKGVGGHGGAHADPLDHLGRYAVLGNIHAGHLGQDAPDALARGVGVVPGIFGEQFDHAEPGFTGYLGIDVGKGAAAVDGKTEFLRIGHTISTN
ncbi:hypothetical protein DESC_720140 [Desulfosarcina cetonica]|nr:hypothetical protein DESC_720140 [Desulfosarcina cetonica]